MMPTQPLHYTIRPKSLEAHLFEVSCTVPDPDPQGQRFQLPAWIPGSYLIRDFARHITSVRAQRGRGRVGIDKIDKHTWLATPTDGALTVTVEVYAFDPSVRGAYLDSMRGFFNGTCVFLRPLGRDERPCDVEIVPPRGARARAWRVATAMRRRDAPVNGFGVYRAANYDELIDHPVEMGTFALGEFEAAGVPHAIAISGRHEADMDRLCRDLKALCTAHIELFGTPAPFNRYLFLVNALGEGYGGLEHRASTALLCSRHELPQHGMRAVTEDYRTFLGLASHEYFHAWNVKGMKPAAFTPYELEREGYTTLLWAFEGITSYYDDLLLVRSGLISEQDYLEVLGRSITALLRTPGRMRQTVSEASFDAWIKYYRQDENSPNAQVSYYLKGSLVALALDLQIRSRTRGRKSLDDVMRTLWKRYGQSGEGVPEDALERIAEELVGGRLRGFFERALRSTEELPLAQPLREMGLEMQLRPAQSWGDRGGRAAETQKTRPPITIGARTAEDAMGVRLTHVLDGGAAQAAGLAPGDVIVALAGLKVNAKNFEQCLKRQEPGDKVEVHFFRRDELYRTPLEIVAAANDTCALVISHADRGAGRRRARWIGSPMT
jgi:predicted metalloprotease with PDZ domain